jgi:hypothetical protein
MSVWDARHKLEALRAHFELLGKGANYLLVGHSAGLVGCLSVIKERSDSLPPQFRSIGLLILIFGTGLLLACLLWLMSMTIQIKLTHAIMTQMLPADTWRNRLWKRSTERLGLFGLWGSLLLFVAAIVLIMSQFLDTIPPEAWDWRAITSKIMERWSRWR